MNIDRDILHLLLPELPSSKDTYGKKVVPLRALSFDRVNEGKAPVSRALLFTLPIEISGQILETLPPSSLATLALVCRDCRQLARSHQFASIKLDYSDHSVALVKKLLAEATIRVGNFGISNNISQSLGACIRRIKVATHPDLLAARYNSGPHYTSNALSERTRGKQLANATKCFFDDYLPKLQLLLDSRSVLPNLEYLDWRDKITLPRSFFECLPFTSIRHLRLSCFKVAEEFEMDLPQPSRGWPLRTLYLDINPNFNKVANVSLPRTSFMCANILRLCAPTLESLTWRTEPIYHDHHSFATYKMESTPRFPRLRSLKLQSVVFSDYSMLDALLEENLRELEVDLGHDALSSEFFESRGAIPTLMTLVWDGKIKPDHSLKFLQENTQLSKLSLQWEASGAFLETQLLPLLRTSFQRLTSLSLKWESEAIPDSALEAVGSLESLQQLHLSAGHQHGWKHNWFIDHGLMRSRLKNLTSLKRMAFSRDGYMNALEGSDPEEYYEERFDFHASLWRDVIGWETWHCESMLDQARIYAAEMPELEWLYFGQLCMEVSRGTEPQVVTADVFALSKERDDCWTYLREMFGFTGT